MSTMALGLTGITMTLMTSGLAGLGVLVAVVVVWAVRRSRAVVFDEGRYPGLVALRRSTLVARYVGLAAGCVALVAAASIGRFGRGLFLAPGAAGAVLILAVMIGQQSAHGSARTRGVAGVEHRRILDYVPRALAVVTLAVLVCLIVAAAWTTSVASVDESGLYREFTAQETVPVAIERGGAQYPASFTLGPFPGGYYTSQLAVGLPIVLVLGSVALWLTTRRPRNGSDPVLVRVDDALRRQTAEGIVAAAGLAFSLSLLGVALSAGIAVGGMAGLGPHYAIGAGALGLLALGSIAVASWCAVLVLVPGGGTVKPS